MASFYWNDWMWTWNKCGGETDTQSMNDWCDDLYTRRSLLWIHVRQTHLFCGSLNTQNRQRISQKLSAENDRNKCRFQMSHVGVHRTSMSIERGVHIVTNVVWSKYCISVRCYVSYHIFFSIFNWNINRNIILLPNKLSHYKLTRIYIRFGSVLFAAEPHEHLQRNK